MCHMSRPEPAAEIEVTLSKSEIAAALGALGVGKKKTLTDAQRAAQRARLAKVRKLRWVRPDTKPIAVEPVRPANIGALAAQLARGKRKKRRE